MSARGLRGALVSTEGRSVLGTGSAHGDCAGAGFKQEVVKTNAPFICLFEASVM